MEKSLSLKPKLRVTTWWLWSLGPQGPPHKKNRSDSVLDFSALAQKYPHKSYIWLVYVVPLWIKIQTIALCIWDDTLVFDVFPELACSGIDQLQKILKLTGTPDPSLVQKMQSKDVRFLQPACFIHYQLALWCITESCNMLSFVINKWNPCYLVFRPKHTWKVSLRKERRISRKCLERWIQKVHYEKN